jgi:hypothetical protein
MRSQACSSAASPLRPCREYETAKVLRLRTRAAARNQKFVGIKPNPRIPAICTLLLHRAAVTAIAYHNRYGAARWLCPLYNYRMPSFRLIAKEKQADGRCKKVYEKKPGTPYERLMESPDVSPECKAELQRRKTTYNPVELDRCLNKAVERLLKINREKEKVKQPSCQEAGRAGAA